MLGDTQAHAAAGLCLKHPLSEEDREQRWWGETVTAQEQETLSGRKHGIRREALLISLKMRQNESQEHGLWNFPGSLP